MYFLFHSQQMVAKSWNIPGPYSTTPQVTHYTCDISHQSLDVVLPCITHVCYQHHCNSPRSVAGVCESHVSASEVIELSQSG